MRSHSDFLLLLTRWTDELRQVVETPFVGDDALDDVLRAVYVEMIEVWQAETLAARTQP